MTAAWRAGIPLHDIAEDSGLNPATIDEWVALDYLRHTTSVRRFLNQYLNP
ncbi:hypothetical protein ACOZ38_20920 [Sphaerisporangium viridialbum]|uniref:hypothetical protein n=1 Tax=Sphaerisporangium viridialbum TaxID=46189 RepID=UPI003C722F57